MITKVCEHCGSKNVYFDAQTKWDETNQKWVLSGLLDSYGCNNCGEEDCIVDVELDLDEKTS